MLRWFTLHSFRLGLQLVFKNWFVSFVAILFIAIAQLALVGLITNRYMGSYVADALTRRVDITVSFLPNTDNNRILEVQTALSRLPEVREVNLVRETEILDEFRKRHQEDYVTLQALNELGVNPFGPQLHIRIKSAGNYRTVNSFLTESSGLTEAQRGSIEHINIEQNKDLLNRIAKFQNASLEISLTAFIIGIVITAFLTGLITRFLAEQFKDDVALMEVLGASKARILGQLCAAYGILVVLATAVTMMLATPLLAKLELVASGFIPGFSVLPWFLSQWHFIAGLVLTLGVAVTHGTVFMLFAHKSKKLF